LPFCSPSSFVWLTWITSLSLSLFCTLTRRSRTDAAPRVPSLLDVVVSHRPVLSRAQAHHHTALHDGAPRRGTNTT
jgi:hypothetical protein